MKSADFDILTEATIEEDKLLIPQKCLDISRIIERLGVSQSEFADILGIPMHLLKIWEEGITPPPRPILLLLRVADRWPEAFIDSLLDY